jgi:hypothetical protein
VPPARHVAARRLARTRAGLAPAILAAALLAGCGTAATPLRPHATPLPPVEVSRHGLTVSLPPGWQAATQSLTPNLVDPREELSVATFPLRYRPTECAHVPGSALDDLGPGDAFVSLLERGRDPGSTWDGFPARPAHFGPGLGGPSEASRCTPGARYVDHWFAFTDGGRHFHVLVAFGPAASGKVQRQAWAILDGLRVDPAVVPDWRSSG